MEATITIVKYKGKIYTGTPQSIAEKLRGKPHYLPLRGIAKLLGVSRTTVNRWLQGNRYAWLTPQWLAGRSDEEIAILLKIKLPNVPYFRRKHKVRKVEWTNVIIRKSNLCKTLFGEGYDSGPLFNVYLRKLAQELLDSDRRKEVILDYYIGGSTVGEGERPFRSLLIAKLKEGNLGLPSKLVELNYLRRC